MSTIIGITQLRKIIKSLDDLILHYEKLKNDSQRTQLSVAFLSGTRSPHIYEVTLQHAHYVRKCISDFCAEVGKSDNYDSPLQSMIQNFKTLIDQNASSELHFMHGENGVLAQIESAYPSNITIPQSIVEKPAMLSLFVIVCQRERDWSMILNSLHSTVNTRPIHECMQSAISCLTNDTMAVIEILIAPRQLIKIPTPGGPTRKYLSILPDDPRFLYDRFYKDYRYSIHNAKLTKIEPHPMHATNASGVISNTS